VRATAAPTRRPARLLRGYASMPVRVSADRVAHAGG
jgi:hypothetical protein